MSHFSTKDWEDFIANNLPESQQLMMEEHLYACENCLADYLHVNEQVHIIDVPETPEYRIEDLLNEMEVVIENEKRHKKTAFKPIWQYVIAASLTIILMSSGMFHHVTGIWKEAESGLTKTPVSLTDSLMDKTLSLLDHLHQTNKEG